jgi:hypothetical protein
MSGIVLTGRVSGRRRTGPAAAAERIVAFHRRGKHSPPKDAECGGWARSTEKRCKRGCGNAGTRPQWSIRHDTAIVTRNCRGAVRGWLACMGADTRLARLQPRDQDRAAGQEGRLACAKTLCGIRTRFCVGRGLVELRSDRWWHRRWCRLRTLTCEALRPREIRGRDPAIVKKAPPKRGLHQRWKQRQRPKNSQRRIITGIGTPSSQSRSPRPILISSIVDLQVERSGIGIVPAPRASEEG